MKQLTKMACLACMILMTVTGQTMAGTKEKESANFDWNPVIEAIIQVESGGNPKAVDKSGKSCGIMQITPVCVQECNRILQIRKSKKHYTLNDRFNVEKSKEMFLLLQSFYNPTHDIEQAIRSWNGGMHYTKRSTQRYYEKVRSKMRQG